MLGIDYFTELTKEGILTGEDYKIIITKELLEDDEKYSLISRAAMFDKHIKIENIDLFFDEDEYRIRAYKLYKKYEKPIIQYSRGAGSGEPDNMKRMILNERELIKIRLGLSSVDFNKDGTIPIDNEFLQDRERVNRLISYLQIGKCLNDIQRVFKNKELFDNNNEEIKYSLYCLKYFIEN